MKRFAKVFGIAFLAAALTVPFAGCDEGSANNAANTAASNTAAGLTNAADTSKAASDVDKACRDYYAGVTSGTITNSDSPAAASPGAAMSAKSKAAKAATVHDALLYSKQTDLEASLSQLSVDDKGNVVVKGSGTKITELSSSTTMGEMYN